MLKPPADQGVDDVEASQPPAETIQAAIPDNFVPDLDGLLYILRDNLRRADAFITTAEELIEQPYSDDNDEGGDGVLRYRMRVEYPVEAVKLAVRAAGALLVASGELRDPFPPEIEELARR